MHKHYLLFPPTLLLLAPFIPSLHLKRTSFWATLEELLFFRVLSNLNKRRSGIWILLCLIKAAQLSSPACSPAVCQHPGFKNIASPQDWWCNLISCSISASVFLGCFFSFSFLRSLLGHKLAPWELVQFVGYSVAPYSINTFKKCGKTKPRRPTDGVFILIKLTNISRSMKSV